MAELSVKVLVINFFLGNNIGMGGELVIQGIFFVLVSNTHSIDLVAMSIVFKNVALFVFLNLFFKSVSEGGVLSELFLGFILEASFGLLGLV